MLSRQEIASQGVHGIRMLAGREIRPVFPDFSFLGYFVERFHVHRPHLRRRTCSTDKSERAGHLTGLGDSHHRPGISFSFGLQVEPHDEFPCFGIIDDLRPFQDAAVGDHRLGVITDFQRDAFIFPVVQVPGRITVDTHMGLVSTPSLRLVLSEPIIGSPVQQDTSAMGIDVHTFIVRPDFTGTKGFALGLGRKQRQQQGEEDQDSFHIYRFFSIFTDIPA